MGAWLRNSVAVWLALGLAACYQPLAGRESFPCAKDGTCPAGYACVTQESGERLCIEGAQAPDAGPAASDAGEACGNGRIDPGEVCDGDCPEQCDDGIACTADSVVGAGCQRYCSHSTVSACTPGDGCCPSDCDQTSDSDCSASCGDGVVDPGETCDGNCPTSCDDGLACTEDRLVGSAIRCSAECATSPITACQGGDGCCGFGCNLANDPDCTAICGNGVLEPGEACDGDCPTACDDHVACTADELLGSGCMRRCNHPAITACAGGDGCCPGGCDAVSDSDCKAEVGFALSEQTVPEATAAPIVRVVLSSPTPLPVAVPFTVRGTASPGADFTLPGGILTFAAGETEVDLPAAITDDLLDEDSETIVVALGTPAGAVLGATTTHTLTILDDDPTPSIAFTQPAQTVLEPMGTASVELALSSPSSWAVTVGYSVGGTASGAGVDFTLAAGTATVPAGATSATITFPVVDDGAAELDETVVLTLSAPSRATLGSPATHTVTISDAKTLVSFESGASSRDESAGSVSLLVELSAAAARDVMVPYTVSGTATGADHSLTGGTLTIPAGSVSRALTFRVEDDTLDEPDETLVITLGAPTNAELASPSVYTLTITDNDAAPTVAFSAAAQSPAESAGTVTAALALSWPSSWDVTVPYTVSGTAGPADHNLAEGSLTIAAGVTAAAISFRITDDALDEPDETVVIELGAPTHASLGATPVHTVTIADNDATPQLSFTAATQSVAESARTATATVRLSAASGQDVRATLTVSGTATSGVDHGLASGFVNIAAGSTSATVTIDLIDDSLPEGNETIVLTLSSPVHATLGTAVQTVTITDDEAPPVVSFAVGTSTFAEGGGTASVAVSLSLASALEVSVPYTVSGTATSADHNLASGTLRIAAGATSGTLSIAVTSDALDENNETVIISLGTPSNATLGTPGTHTLTITDDDNPPTVSFAVAAQSVAEPSSVTATVRLSAGSGLSVSVPYTVSGTASAADHNAVGGTVTISPGQTDGTITFAVSADTLDENDETVVLTLGAPTNATAGATTVHTATILDDDPTPTVAFAESARSLVEGSLATTSVSLNLSAVSGRAVTVPYTVTGTASGGGVDHSLSNGTVTINAGATTGSLSIPLVSDNMDEPDETIVVTLGTPTGATATAPATFTLTITDNDSPPSVEFTAHAATVSEAAGGVTVGARLSAASAYDVAAEYVVSGSATAPADHNLASGTLTFPAGATTASITFSVYDDVSVEPDERVNLSLVRASYATLAAISSTYVAIRDNDQTSLSQVQAVAVGESHSCAIVDGRAKCWGGNARGQLGDGTTTFRTRPVTPIGLSSGVVEIAAGDSLTCARVLEGTNQSIKCWGYNAFGQVGDGTLTDRTTPTPVLGATSGATALTVGFNHACAVVAGVLKCWGLNGSGQLGDGTLANRSTPVTVSSLTAPIGAIGAGYAGWHTCAVDATGLKCWGANNNGQLGDGTTTNRPTPAAVSGISGVTMVDPGANHTCALAGGRIYCWGAGSIGQLGTGNTSQQLLPTLVNSLSSVTTIATGYLHSCAVSGGQAWCWGNNAGGQLGSGTTSQATAPAAVVGLTGVTAMSAGNGTTCAVASGGLKCWGMNQWAQVANEGTSNAVVPVETAGLGSAAITALAASDGHSCVISAGKVYCWGSNSTGQVGDGTMYDRAAAVEVPGIGSATALATGRMHTCVIDGGTVKCWGMNTVGQIGDGTTFTRYVPVSVTVPGTPTALTAGEDHTCALSGGALYCWGKNNEGQLGDGTVVNKSSPVAVTGLSSGVTALSAGMTHTCAIVLGSVKCWGYNQFYGLGDGTTTRRTTPVDVAGLTGSVTGIVAGQYSTCAILAFNALWCWGGVSGAATGLGPVAAPTAPTLVTGMSSGVTAASGSIWSGTCAVVGGAAKCTGSNYYGFIGDGTLVSRDTFTNVSGMSSGAGLISAGMWHACGTVGNSVRCWGQGGIGSGAQWKQIVPVDVLNLMTP